MCVNVVDVVGVVSSFFVGGLGLSGASPVPQNLTSNLRREFECDDAEVGTDFCELSIAAFEDEMAERVGHRVAFAAWASGLGRRACELAVKSRLEHEHVRVLPFDEAALPGFGDVVEAGCKVRMQSGYFDESHRRLSEAR